MITSQPMTVFDSGARRQRLNAILAWVTAHNGGGRAWRQWKKVAAERLVDLIGNSPRMELFELNLEGDLEAVFEIRCPVPRRPENDRLVIGNRAVCYLLFQDRWRFESPPGWALFGVLSPDDLFHSNLNDARPQWRGALCLGGLPPNTQPTQILLAAYDALTLQAINIDETDPAGVLNPEASEFYRRHPEYLPLTRAGLLDPVDLDPKGCTNP
jgi:hypothetical protein